MKKLVYIIALLFGVLTFGQELDVTLKTGNTDRQKFEILEVIGDTLHVKLENDILRKIPISLAGPIEDFYLTGNILTLELKNGTTFPVDLSPIAGGASTLDGLTDVSTSGATSGQVLKYDGANWVPGTDNDTGGSGGVSANEFRATSVADLTNPANAHKKALMQNNITLTANTTLADGVILDNAGGYLILDGFTLFGSAQSSIDGGDQDIVIDCSTGTLAGSWKAPSRVYATNFGAIPDGRDHSTGLPVDKSGTGNINVASTPTVLTVPDANFTADRVGQTIVVMNGGNDTTYENALITTIQEVTNSTTVVLADAAQNVGSRFWTVSNGLDDLSVSGVYTGTENLVIRVEIDGTGTPNTFRWSKDDGATYEATNVPITGSPQLLEQGISITFGSTTGHDGTGTVDTWFVKGFNLTKTRVFYGTDNYNALYQGLRKVRNTTSGEFVLNGHFMTSTIKRVTPSSAAQDGLLLGDKVDNVVLRGENGILQTFPFDFNNADAANVKRTDLITIYHTKNSQIKDLTLVGSYFSEYDLTEYPAGVNYVGAINPRIENVKATQFQGDGMVCSGDGQLENGIQGTNMVGAAFDTGLSFGRLLPDGTIDTGQTNYVYSTDPVLISGGNFNDFKAVAGYAHFALTGAGFSGWSGLTYDWYDAIIYDGNDNFVAFLPNLRFYDDIIIQQENWKKIRVCFKDVADKENVDLRLRADLNALNVHLINVDLTYNGRQGFSNFTTGFFYNGGMCHNNGGRLPGYGIDGEDPRRKARDIKITNVIFFDNAAGDIALIGAENVIISNNIFKSNMRPDWGNGLALYGTYCRDLIFTDNHLTNKDVNVARGAIVSNLKMDGGTIDIGSLGCSVNDIEGRNIKIFVDGTNSDGHNKVGTNSTIRNVTIRMDQPYDFILSDKNALGQWENIKIFLNDPSEVSNLIQNTDLDASLKVGQTLWEQVPHTAGQPYGGGYIKGMTIRGNLINEDLTSATPSARFPQFEYTEDISIDAGITLGYYGSGAVDILWKNLKCNYLDIDPRNGSYLTSIPGDEVANPAPVWTFENAEIINRVGEYAMTNVNYRQIQVEDFWLDVVFKDSKIINEVAYSNTLNRTSFLELDNYGSVYFIDCEIGNAGSDGGTVGNDIVLTNTWFREASRPKPIIFENPTLLYGTAITKRTADLIRFNRTSPELLTYGVYADDAAATTAGYSSGYMYVTATGELRFKL